MVIGTRNVSLDELKQYSDNTSELLRVVERMVPSWARHIRPVVDNQRFYVATLLRRAYSIPYKKRMSMAECLISGIRVRGVMSGFTPITDIVATCNKEALLEMLNERC